MHKYRLVAKKGEGTFSEVLKAQSVVTGEYFAVKCMKNHFKSIEQVNSLREIQALRRLNPHDNIIPLEEVLFDEQSGRLALVFELMDMNIYELIRGRKQYLKPSLVKMLMYQLMKAVAHMHKNGIFHRDIKPENILIHNEELKIADLGSCRGMYTKQPFTEYISTRWYRAPECLLTNGYYDYNMDLWGVGCVMFEIVSLFPLFPGTNELDQIDKVHSILGTPTPEVLEMFKKHTSHISTFNFPQKEGTGIARLIPHAEPECTELIELLVAYNPEDRISAKQSLKHAYFREVRERERGRVRTASPKRVDADSVPRVDEPIKTKRNKKDKKLPQVGATTNNKKSKDRKTRRRKGSQDKGKTQLSIGSSDDEEAVAAELIQNASADSEDFEESNFGMGDETDSTVKRGENNKNMVLAPSIVKNIKTKNKKPKKSFNSSATNLPTILPPSFGNNNNNTATSMGQGNANNNMSHLSLNITSYRPKAKGPEKAQQGQYHKVASGNTDPRTRTIDNRTVQPAAKKKNLPQGLQVAAMSYKKKSKPAN